MTDAPERLRKLAANSNDGYLAGPALAAADTIERLQRERDTLEARLAAAERLANLAPTAIAYLDKYEPVGFTVANEFRAALTEWEAAKGERG